MKKKFYRTDKLRMRTKLEIGLMALFLVLLIVGVSVGSVNRTISNTHDDIDTFIRNSNGYYWEATASNLQAAIDDLGSNGGVVWLPNATIVVKQIWINETNITLRGYNSCIKLDETKALQFADGQGVLTIQADFVTVDGVEIDGSMDWNGTNMPARTTVNINGIYTNDVEYCVIRNCEIHHVQFNGIENYAMDYSLIEYNYVHHIGNTSEYDSIGGTGIRFKGTAPGSHYNVIQYNNIHDIHEHGIKDYEVGADPYDPHCNKIMYNFITDCNLGDWDDSGTPYGYGICSPGCNNLVMGNTIIMNNGGSTGPGAMMAAGITTKTNATVINNYIIRESPYAVAMIFLQEGKNCIVKGNVLEGNDASLSAASSYAIAFQNPSNSTVENNMIRNIKYGIKLQAKTADAIVGYSVNNTISGNVINNCDWGIYLQSDTVAHKNRDNVIADNVFQSCTIPIHINTVTLINQSIFNNIGYDYSSYQYIPTGTSSPYQYKTVSAGAMWLNTTTGMLGIYDGVSWIWK